MLVFQKKFDLKAWGNSPFSYVLTRAGIVFGFVTNSVSSWASKVFLTSWFLFFQINLLLARGHVDSELSSYFLTLLVVAGAVIHTVLYNLPSTTLSWVYSWLVNRAKFLVVYLGILASFGYLSGASFLSFLVQLRTFFGEAAKNLVETGGLSGIFPYGDLELGFIDVAGAYTLFQGFFISSSGLSLLLQNSMFVSLAFILVFPFCLGTGVFLEGVILSVGFPLFHVSSSPLPKDLPSIVKHLDKNLVAKHPNLEKLFVKQPKSFLPFVYATPHPDIDEANKQAALAVRSFLLEKGEVNVGSFYLPAEPWLKAQKGPISPTQSLLLFNFVRMGAIYGVILDSTTGRPIYELGPRYSSDLLLNDPQHKGDPLGSLKHERAFLNAGFETFTAKGLFSQFGRFAIRPSFDGITGPDLSVGGIGVEVKTKTGSVLTVKPLEALSKEGSNGYGKEVALFTSASRIPVSFPGPVVSAAQLNLHFTEKSLLSVTLIEAQFKSDIGVVDDLD